MRNFFEWVFNNTTIAVTLFYHSSFNALNNLNLSWNLVFFLFDGFFVKLHSLWHAEEKATQEGKHHFQVYWRAAYDCPWHWLSLICQCWNKPLLHLRFLKPSTGHEGNQSSVIWEVLLRPHPVPDHLQAWLFWLACYYQYYKEALLVLSLKLPCMVTSLGLSWAQDLQYQNYLVRIWPLLVYWPFSLLEYDIPAPIVIVLCSTLIPVTIFHGTSCFLSGVLKGCIQMSSGMSERKTSFLKGRLLPWSGCPKSQVCSSIIRCFQC